MTYDSRGKNLKKLPSLAHALGFPGFLSDYHFDDIPPADTPISTNGLYDPKEGARHPSAPTPLLYIISIYTWLPTMVAHLIYWPWEVETSQGLSQTPALMMTTPGT